MCEREDQMIERDLEQLEEVGHDIELLGIDSSYDLESIVEAIDQHLQRLSRVRASLFILSQH